ncbi:hypothetical protein DFQ05_1224 [Winogradskyella wandonensis]|uniref:Uncharacterized protein n=1 Tax=Winogradskyella wandonensis TaxID=1442586 RepID=A0A4R1KQZ6_9FLAO|nr:hypothetical protein [Winogradskyella wandonensis]TCK67448.1 hypothetical protein DFQ05_1224 [Winogradskyella wandonensis]
MAPIKFEEQIKDKLEQRTLTPSTDAWSKLSQQLDAEDKRNKRKSFWWFGIAASVAALVFLSISFFNNEDENSLNDIIVKDKIKETISSQPEGIFQNETNDNSENQLVITEQKETLEHKSETTKKEKLQQSLAVTDQRKQNQLLQKVSAKKENSAVAKAEKQKLLELDKIKLKKSSAEDLIQTPKVEFNSVADVLQEVKSSNKTTVTDQQIDSLLKVANRELLMDKTIKKKTNIVNADALLQDVEEAMGQSFRTRIYETLKGGYEEVKTRVAQRND